MGLFKCEESDHPEILPRHHFRVHRVRLNAGGYAPGGEYFGNGAPLFAFECDCGEHAGKIRAEDRAAALGYVRERFENAVWPRSGERCDVAFMRGPSRR